MRIIKVCATLAFLNYLAINLTTCLEIHSLSQMAEAARVAAFVKLSGATTVML